MLQCGASVDSRVLSSSVASQRLTLSKTVSDQELYNGQYRACVHMYHMRIRIANALRRGLVSTFINPRRACAARVTVVILCVCLAVCLSVCFFVSDYSRTTGYEAAYERYQQIQCHKGRKNNVAILLKRLRSRDIA